MGKLKAENPQLSVYYNDREHVTIHSTNSSQALNTISDCYTLHKLRYEQVTSSNLLHKSACLYCAIQDE